jgi:hypothetical protein
MAATARAARLEYLAIPDPYECYGHSSNARCWGHEW